VRLGLEFPNEANEGVVGLKALPCIVHGLANCAWIERDFVSHKAVAFVLRESPAFIFLPYSRGKDLFESFGDMEVDVTGDQEKRTSPKSKMRIGQRGGSGMVCKDGDRYSEKQQTSRVIL
jgi:hypothetical protein